MTRIGWDCIPEPLGDDFPFLFLWSCVTACPQYSLNLEKRLKGGITNDTAIRNLRLRKSRDQYGDKKLRLEIKVWRSSMFKRCVIRYFLEGEIMVICGPSGSGKSTLIRFFKPSWRNTKKVVLCRFFDQAAFFGIARSHKVNTTKPWHGGFRIFKPFSSPYPSYKLRLGLMWLRKMSGKTGLKKRVMGPIGSCWQSPI